MSAVAMTPLAEAILDRPLGAGQPVTYWRLGATQEARYDTVDQPMKGEMDPFFFLTKHKNFIPHEYPCRTEFAEERRGKRPTVTAELSTDRIWLPFASPRVDLSGLTTSSLADVQILEKDLSLSADEQSAQHGHNL